VAARVWRHSSVVVLVGAHYVLVSPDPPGSWWCTDGASAHSGRRR